MSSLVVFGFFGVAAGRRVATQKPNSSTRTYHCFYSTTLQSSSGVALPAELRVYSPFNDSVLPDNTVAFVVARAHAPLHDTVLLEAIHVVPLPGDPTDEAYEASLPDCPFPFVIGLGVVPTNTETLADGVSKAFNVLSNEFVRDSVKPSTVQCMFDGSRPRWLRTPTPNVNSTVQYFGTFAFTSPTGGIRVNVESITFNVGHQDLMNTPAAIGPTPAKKRKFAAFASPATPSNMFASTSQSRPLVMESPTSGSSTHVLAPVFPPSTPAHTSGVSVISSTIADNLATPTPPIPTSESAHDGVYQGTTLYAPNAMEGGIVETNEQGMCANELLTGFDADGLHGDAAVIPQAVRSGRGCSGRRGGKT